MREFERRRGNRATWRAFRESKDPRVFIPLAEDTAALLGLAVAFAGVFLSRRFSMPALDAVASMVIGVILAVVALVLARETRSLIVGEPASEKTVRAIREAVAADPAVAGVDEVMTMHSSPDSIFLNVEVSFREDAPLGELTQVIERVKHRIRAVDRRISRVFVEVKSSRQAAEARGARR
jgi:divalent metal cation (Fe/Co/Zn/Cd) transporter